MDMTGNIISVELSWRKRDRVSHDVLWSRHIHCRKGLLCNSEDNFQNIPSDITDYNA